MFTASVILAIMIFPVISSISRDVMRAVPTSQREAALALGATRWEMLRIERAAQCAHGHHRVGDPGPGASAG